MSAAEAGGALGPEWPDRAALAGLQKQCAELARALHQGSSMTPHTNPAGGRSSGGSSSPDATAAAAAARGMRLARSLLAVLRGAAYLEEAMGAAPSAGDAAEAGEALRLLQQATVRGTPG